MQCEMCQKVDATVRIKQVQAGKLREVWVCEACAVNSAKEAHAAPSLSTLLFNSAPEPKPAAKEAVRCPRCGMGLSEMYKRRQFGCAVCFESLSEHVKAFVDDMQGGAEHRGKIPSRERETATRLQVRQAMADAVRKQDFETAARYRDQLRSMNATQSPIPPKGKRE